MIRSIRTEYADRRRTITLVAAVLVASSVRLRGDGKDVVTLETRLHERCSGA